MTKAAESEPLDLEDDVKPIKDEIKKPNIFLKHWKKKDTPYGNDYTTNFAQSPDSPRYPDEDKGYKSETYIGGKKKKGKIEEPEERKIQQVDDEEAAATYYGDIPQQKVGTKLNDPNTSAGKFFGNQPKSVRQHFEHTAYDPEVAEKWKAELNKISQVHLMNVDDESPPAEKGLTHNADARQAAKGRAVEKILPAIPMIANIATSLASGGGEEEEETTKSHHTNCPYCNGKSNNKQHDENPDKFHAWMDSERQKSMLTNTRFMNKIESADPTRTQHQPKRRRAHIMDAGKPARDIRSRKEDTKLDLQRRRVGAVPKKDIRNLGTFDSEGNWVNPKERENITPPSHKINPNPKFHTVKEPKSKAAPTDTRSQPDASDIITPKPRTVNQLQSNLFDKPKPETPKGGESPNLKPRERKGVKGYLSNVNPFKGSKQKPAEQGYMIDDIGNIGVKVGGGNPNQKTPKVDGQAVDIGKNTQSFYSFRTKDGYGSGDLDLANVIPNTVVNDKETYIGQTASGKHRMVDRNKITKTKVGDDIHFFVNGVEDRGIVVKMGNEYLQIFKEDGQFHNIHINDTFFVKDIIINKEWDKMDSIERYEVLHKIHAPSPRFIGKSWNELPVEIKELLTKDVRRIGGTGSKIQDENPVFTPPAPPALDAKADENTKYFSAHTGKLLGTGAKGRLAQQNEKEPNVNELKSEDFRKLKPTYQGDAEEKNKGERYASRGRPDSQSAPRGGEESGKDWMKYWKDHTTREPKKSDVEEGTYGNVGNTSDIAPSTSTNLDVSESTGYEERPHISVEEVGSLPRRDAKDNNDDETKEKEDDIKEPKESKDTKKVGVPTGNYNTFGLTYSVKANTVWNKKTQRWEQKDEY